MSTRRRPDHAAAMGEGRGDRSRLRARRRRRRVLLGFVRLVFWALVLAGVFVLGLGYGRTLSGDDEMRSDKVTVTSDLGEVQATLPTRTETVVTTVTVAAKPKGRTKAVAAAPKQ
ncbi:MAG: hypothetical protein JWM98_2258 [Thermoleophilia bacterium]|nr:hypothetical protein [Thermoleophilia bacterium]